MLHYFYHCGFSFLLLADWNQHCHLCDDVGSIQVQTLISISVGIQTTVFYSLLLLYQSSDYPLCSKLIDVYDMLNHHSFEEAVSPFFTDVSFNTSWVLTNLWRHAQYPRSEATLGWRILDHPSQTYHHMFSTKFYRCVLNVNCIFFWCWRLCLFTVHFGRYHLKIHFFWVSFQGFNRSFLTITFCCRLVRVVSVDFCLLLNEDVCVFSGFCL